MIIGIDPSFTCTACVAGDGSGDYQQQTFPGGSLPLGSPMKDRMFRAGRMAIDVATWCAKFEPGMIIIEGYAYAPKYQQGHHDLVEGAAILRHEVTNHCGRAKLIEIFPNTLKLWASGHGRAKKDFMADAIESRYGVRMLSHDLLDAWCLWKMGCQLLKRAEPKCAHEAKAIEGLLHPVIKEQVRRPRGRKAIRFPKQKRFF